MHMPIINNLLDRPWPDQRLRVFELAIFFAVFGVLLFLGHVFYADPIAYNSDDLRYINYANTINKYGIFGLSNANNDIPPLPGNANAPLYLFWIAGIMKIDSGLRETIHCVLTTPGFLTACTHKLGVFYVFQYGLALLSLLFVFLTTLEFSEKRSMAWLATLLAFLSLKLITFSTIFMTEIMITPFFFAMIYFLLRALKTKHVRWVLLIGAMLALLTLTRPSYLYLFYGFVVFFLGAICWQRNRMSVLKLGALILGFVIIISPWAIRNKIQFDDYTLTSGQYAEIILSQRVSYNRMNWKEWAVSFIYWAPGFGDNLAEDLFSKEDYERLSWAPGSYYDEGWKILYHQYVEAAGGKENALRHIVKEELIDNAFKHVMVSIPLAWRGVFFSKTWGMLGFVCTIILLVHMQRRKDYRFLLLSLPFVFMVMFHAGLSVSIARYNIHLMLLYALSMAWYGDGLVAYGREFLKTLSRRKRS